MVSSGHAYVGDLGQQVDLNEMAGGYTCMYTWWQILIRVELWSRFVIVLTISTYSDHNVIVKWGSHRSASNGREKEKDLNLAYCTNPKYKQKIRLIRRLMQPKIRLQNDCVPLRTVSWSIGPTVNAQWNSLWHRKSIIKLPFLSIPLFSLSGVSSWVVYPRFGTDFDFFFSNRQFYY